MFRVPLYSVDKNSNFTAFETKNALEESMAESSFSMKSIEIAL